MNNITVVNKIKASIIEDAEKKLSIIQNNVNHLKKEGVPASISEIKKYIRKDGFKKYMETALSSYLGQAMFIPSSEKVRVTESFNDVYKRLIEPVTLIGDIMRDCPYTLKEKENVLYFDEKEVDAYATQKATIEFSPKEMEYYSLIKEIADKINSLDKWESEHGYYNFAKNGIMSINGLGAFITHSFSEEIKDGVNPDWYLSRIRKFIGKLPEDYEDRNNL